METSTLSTFRNATSIDETSRIVMDYVVNGWPEAKDQVDEHAREYWSYREELSVEDGLLFKSDRIVVPRAMRPEVLDDIHGAHMGETKSLCFARDYVFWPGKRMPSLEDNSGRCVYHQCLKGWIVCCGRFNFFNRTCMHEVMKRI